MSVDKDEYPDHDVYGCDKTGEIVYAKITNGDVNLIWFDEIVRDYNISLEEFEDKFTRISE